MVQEDLEVMGVIITTGLTKYFLCFYVLVLAVYFKSKGGISMILFFWAGASMPPYDEWG